MRLYYIKLTGSDICSFIPIICFSVKKKEAIPLQDSLFSKQIKYRLVADDHLLYRSGSVPFDHQVIQRFG